MSAEASSPGRAARVTDFGGEDLLRHGIGPRDAAPGTFLASGALSAPSQQDTRLHLVHTSRPSVEALSNALDLLPVGVILLDRSNRPVIINAYARQVFHAKGAASLMTVIQQQLASGLRNGANAKRPSPLPPPIARSPDDSGRLISIPRSESARALSALMFSLPRGGGAGGAEDLAHIVFLNDPDREIVLNRARLRELYGLTPAEARLAALLAEGRNLKSVASELGITLHTARTHLKRIFGKTAAKNQAHLVRLLLDPMSQIGSILGLGAVMSLSSALALTASAPVRDEILVPLR